MSNDLSKLTGINIPKLDMQKLNIPKFDTSALVDFNNMQRRKLDSSMNALNQVYDAENRRKQEVRQATIETAENTAEMKSDLKTVIHNQNDYIAMLKGQNEYIKQVLNNMFGSSEDSVQVQKEILKMMQESKPTDGMVADKGFDVVIQMVFGAVQMYLKSKGIFF